MKCLPVPRTLIFISLRALFVELLSSTVTLYISRIPHFSLVLSCVWKPSSQLVIWLVCSLQDQGASCKRFAVFTAADSSKGKQNVFQCLTYLWGSPRFQENDCIGQRSTGRTTRFSYVCSSSALHFINLMPFLSVKRTTRSPCYEVSLVSAHRNFELAV